METYQISLDFTDTTEYDAETEAEALDLAREMFKEEYPQLNGRYDLTVINVKEVDLEE
jgi:hypothetical protein